MKYPSSSSRAVDDLTGMAYDELRTVAHRYLRGERDKDVLQTTALVHEAFLRLRKLERIDWESRRHFVAVAATQMRRILIDRARALATDKRGGGVERITLHEALVPASDQAVDVLDVDHALRRLSCRSPRQGRVAEMRIFGGFHAVEIAEILGVSERTVKSDWRVARAWLSRELRLQRRAS